MTKKFAITIGRQLGSGGREIGREIAVRLKISYYDKELLQIASRESGLGKEFFEEMDEKKSHSLFGGIFDLRNILAEGYYSNAFLTNETLFKIQSDVIRSLAEKQSCLFLGRCADYVLKDLPECLNFYISANLSDRIKRISGGLLFTLPLRQTEEVLGKLTDAGISSATHIGNCLGTGRGRIFIKG